MKTLFIVWLVVLLAPLPAFAQWYPPLTIESAGAYYCGSTGVYTFDVILSRPVVGDFSWTEPGSWYDQIVVTVWLDEAAMDRDDWCRTTITTYGLGAVKVLNYQCRMGSGGEYRQVVGDYVENVTSIWQDARHVRIIMPRNRGTYLSWGKPAPAYRIESMRVFNTGHGKEYLVDDSRSGVTLPDPRCMVPIVPIKERTWGAIKNLYQ